MKNLGPTIIQGETNPETHPFCRVEFVKDQYDMLLEQTSEQKSDLFRKIEMQEIINLALEGQKFTYEDGIVETPKEFIARLQQAVDRERVIRTRLQSAGPERTYDEQFRPFNIHLWPPIKNFIEGLVNKVNLPDTNLGTGSKEGIILTSFLPQQETLPTRYSRRGFPMSEDRARQLDRESSAA